MKYDIKQTVTYTILEQLEKGTAPWRCGWDKENPDPFVLPMNCLTGYVYQGVNVLLLWESTRRNGFHTNDWATFKQFNAQNEKIRRGEKGTPIVYYNKQEKEIDGEMQEIPFIHQSIVFNRCQLESYDHEKETKIIREPLVEWDEGINAFIKNTKATILYDGGNAAFYRHSTDDIHLPLPKAFVGTDTQTATEAFYATTLHEIAHWTGHPTRLNREFGKRFGDQAYAFEELVAELTCAYECADLGVHDGKRPDHANYMGSWIDVLKKDKGAIFTAASQASKAFDYLDGLQPR
jgi:antirestriction protein ArdC